jgi:predicted DNA-binding transcriptional regulator AlpA
MSTETTGNTPGAEGAVESSARILRRDFELLTPEDLAALIGVDTRTLAEWRAQKRGPDVTKLGRAVFYRHEDVRRWIDLNVSPSDRVN